MYVHNMYILHAIYIVQYNMSMHLYIEYGINYDMFMMHVIIDSSV